MKQICLHFVLLVLLSLNSFAAPVQNVEIVPLTKKPLLALPDFKKAAISGTGSQVILTLTLSPSAAERMQEFTSRNVGSKLPFLVDGQLIEAPTIRAPITGQEVQVGPIARDLAGRIARAVEAQQR